MGNTVQNLDLTADICWVAAKRLIERGQQLRNWSNFAERVNFIAEKRRKQGTANSRKPERITLLFGQKKLCLPLYGCIPVECGDEGSLAMADSCDFCSDGERTCDPILSYQGLDCVTGVEVL